MPCLYMAFSEGQPIAGTLAIHYGDKVWYLYGASSNEHRNLMPNYLLQWRMIQWAVETGCRIYDFRGVSGDLSEDNPLYGLYKFKKGFGGEFTEFVGEMDLVLNKAVYFAVEHGTNVLKELPQARISAQKQNVAGFRPYRGGHHENLCGRERSTAQQHPYGQGAGRRRARLGGPQGKRAMASAWFPWRSSCGSRASCATGVTEVSEARALPGRPALTRSPS